MEHYDTLQPPTEGEKITATDDGRRVVPDHPIVPFIEGDGNLIERALEGTLEQKRVTYDFHRQMEGATKLSCSGFGDAIIENIQNV